MAGSGVSDRDLRRVVAASMIGAMQKELEVLKAGRPKYTSDPFGLIAAGHIVAIEFATISAANNYWRR